MNTFINKIMIRTAVLIALASVSIAATAAETNGEKLFEEKRCYICHEANKMSLGPPLAAIAARHAPRKEIMNEVLAQKIVNGGGGNWGVVPMVPNQWVSIEEARVLADWILSLSTQP
jgi:cytochrome c